MATKSSAGYSGTPLPRKLGIKPGDRVVVRNPPKDYDELIQPLPEGATISSRFTKSNRFIHYFAMDAGRLAGEFPHLKAKLDRDGILWISWPKKSSGVATNVDEATVRAIGLDNGLVDVKVCAVDETWSGLKFMFRLKDR